jgi:hypothetical protein
MKKVIDPRMAQKLAKPNFTYQVGDKEVELDSLRPKSSLPTADEIAKLDGLNSKANIGLKQEAEASLDRLAGLLKETTELQSSLDKILESRDKLYGDFAGQAAISQELKFVMHESRNRDNLEPYQKEALEMIQLKIARILNGDPSYIDSWQDIAGYAMLVVNELKAEQEV